MRAREFEVSGLVRDGFEIPPVFGRVRADVWILVRSAACLAARRSVCLVGRWPVGGSGIEVGVVVVSLLGRDARLARGLRGAILSS